MKKYIAYLRVSTDKQDNGQQKRTIDNYCERNNITPHIEITEIEHSSVRFEDRALMDALNIAKRGDQIICSESSRVVRNGFDEMYRIKQKCAEIGCTIYCIAENLCYGAEVEGAKDSDEMISIIRMAVAAGTSKIERSLIRMRSQSKLDLIKDIIKRDGHYITKKGVKIYSLGNSNKEKEAIGQVNGNIASAKSRQDAIAKNPEFQKSYYFAKLLTEKGISVGLIVKEMDKVGFKSPQGCKITNISRLLKSGKEKLEKY